MTTSGAGPKHQDVDPQILADLKDLSYFDSVGGPHSGLADPGEARGAMAELNASLIKRGARYHYDRQRREYVLDSVGPPPGAQGPDR